MISNLRVGGRGGEGDFVFGVFSANLTGAKKLSWDDGVEGNRWAAEATALREES